VPNPKSAGNINLAAKENVSSGLRLLALWLYLKDTFPCTSRRGTTQEGQCVQPQQLVPSSK